MFNFWKPIWYSAKVEFADLKNDLVIYLKLVKELLHYAGVFTIIFINVLLKCLKSAGRESPRAHVAKFYGRFRLICSV